MGDLAWVKDRAGSRDERDEREPSRQDGGLGFRWASLGSIGLCEERRQRELPIGRERIYSTDVGQRRPKGQGLYLGQCAHVNDVNVYAYIITQYVNMYLYS